MEPISQQLLRELRRWSGLQFAPAAGEAWQELGKVLTKRCRDFAHTQRVIERWLETEDNVPTPAKLAAFIQSVPADAALDNPELAPPCDVCAPDGLWVYVEIVRPSGEISEALRRCKCS